MDWRQKRLGLAVAWLLAGVTPAFAQAGDGTSPSPFAPGDLKAPIFDTHTRVYDTTDVEAKTAGMVVADVDGRSVTLGDVRDAIAELPPAVRNLPFDDLFPGIRAQLVRQQALAIRAQRQALDEDPAVRRKIKTVSDRVLSDELLKLETARPITEAALLARYNAEVAGKPGPDEVRVRVIMLSTEQEAAGVIGELRGGADFAALARRLSKDATAASGGDAGFVTLDKLTPEVAGAVSALEPGRISAFPVRSGGAWFVLKVEERRQLPARPFSAVRQELVQTMIREGVPDVVSAALGAVTVRLFDMNGKEAEVLAGGESVQIKK